MADDLPVWPADREVRVLGLMSGTSLDGLDLAACRIRLGPPLDLNLEAFETVAFPQRLHAELLGLDGLGMADLARLDADLGWFFAEAGTAFCARHGFAPELIGSHGQTVVHQGGTVSWQLGEPTFLAHALDCPVVARFRQADIALGGSGAPLVPFIDALLFADPQECRVALNVGGIANVTLLQPGSGTEAVQAAFDTGPGNMVIDELARRASNGALDCDRDGLLASTGRIDAGLLEAWLNHPFLQAAAPKSAGREQFGPAFVDALLAQRRPENAQDWADLIATATAWTAQSIADAVRDHAPAATRMIVSGGGLENPVLMAELQRRVGNAVQVVSSATHGVAPDGKEAMAFALLALCRMSGIPAGVPACTGATRPGLLGAIVTV